MLKLSLKDEPSMDEFRKTDTSSWEDIKESIKVRLVNKKSVNQYDPDIARKEMLDLAYTISLQERDGDYIKSHMLTNEELKELGVKFEEAFSEAVRNSDNDRSKRLTSLRESMMSNGNMLAPICDVPDGDQPLMMHNPAMVLIHDLDENDKENVLVLSNSKGVLGASLGMLESTLNEVYDRFKESFYIIPMSINEMMYIKESYALKNGKKPRLYAEDDMLDMVETMNSGSNVNWKDILSYKIYLYDTDENAIIMIKR